MKRMLWYAIIALKQKTILCLSTDPSPADEQLVLHDKLFAMEQTYDETNAFIRRG
jgi:hypothetical protein